MHYDLSRLAKEKRFDVKVLEKVCLMSDILEEISQDRFLGDRLSLIGGTALNLIYCEDLPRLSVDLDFNYRHIDQRDWGEVRSDIDERLKNILEVMGYDDLSIDASYPLGRLTIHYLDHLGREDKLKVEVSYMRRFPLLKNDRKGKFLHMGKGKRIAILTPKREELFAEKLVAGIYRRTPRDVFDIATVSGLKFNPVLLRKCAVLESLAHEDLRIHELDLGHVFGSVHIDTALASLLRKDISESLYFEKVRAQAIKFCKGVMDGLTTEEISAIRKFYEKGEFKPDLIVEKGEFHEEIENHPAIRWTLQKLKQKNPSAFKSDQKIIPT